MSLRTKLKIIISQDRFDIEKERIMKSSKTNNTLNEFTQIREKLNKRVDEHFSKLK